MPRKKKPTRVIAVADTETDPFLHGRTPEPFSVGLYFDSQYFDFWGDDCVNQFLDKLKEIKTPLRIYMHNGGKFDFFFFLKHLENPVKIINGRIVVAHIGIHEFRDSYAIIPVPLKAYAKDDIAYWKFERRCREKYRKEIEAYQKTDCIYLYDLVSAFNNRFGDRLTIGGTAIKELEKVHPFQKGNAEHDAKFRPFYFGGRVEAFCPGKHVGDIRVYDVNSMYPSVMKDELHPTGTRYIEIENFKIDANGDIVKFPGVPYFAEIECDQRGAFPTRLKNGLDFNVSRGTFTVTSHELKVALKHKLVKIHRRVRAYVPCFTIKFDKYIDEHKAARDYAKSIGDHVNDIFEKLLMNSAYGKFGQDPSNYFDWQILPRGCWPDDSENWSVYEQHDDVTIFQKPIERHSYFDVAVAASITGAARAKLLDAISQTGGVLYCDTDSIICSGQFGGDIDPLVLGKWKHEATLHRISIAGKKMYAGRGFDSKGKPLVKMASKGVKCTALQIEKMCSGSVIEWKSQAPNFKLSGEVKFVKRLARAAKTC